MSAARLLLALLALGLPAPGAAAPPSRDWLVGTWILIEREADRDLDLCDSGLPITYRADGTYSLFEETGVWRLRGRRLTETATAATAAGDPADVEIGRPYRSRIARVGPDEMRKRFADGARMTLLRCPPAG